MAKFTDTAGRVTFRTAYAAVQNAAGVTDHGALTGLADDDHTQYAKKASNLSDLSDAATARTNLGLGSAATQASTAFAPATRTVGTSLGTSGTVDLDMASVHGTIQRIAATGSLTFTTSNRAAGREVTIIIAAGGSSRTLAWPSWVAVGAALPTTLASGKTLVATVTFTDTTDAAAVAAAAVQL